MYGSSARGLLTLAAVAATAGASFAAIAPAQERPASPPANAGFDYQIGGDYPLPGGTTVVSRDWFEGRAAAPPAYSICYVNAFQTQDDEAGVRRRDERSQWPRGLVLRELGDDPKWGGEYLVDLSTPGKRRRAAAWVQPMLRTCARKGFDAVEFDNLDSWTRFDGTPRAADVPFGKAGALAHARLLVRHAHALGLAVAQKNTPQLTRREARGTAGFDFAIAEQCARYSECGRYRALYGDRVIDIEYGRRAFRRACRTVGSRLSVVLRDLNVSTPRSPAYRYDAC